MNGSTHCQTLPVQRFAHDAQGREVFQQIGMRADRQGPDEQADGSAPQRARHLDQFQRGQFARCQVIEAERWGA